MKRHSRHMTQDEKDKIMARLAELEPVVRLTDYARQRLSERGRTALPAFSGCQLIEFNNENGDSRALLRESPVCFVVSLRTGHVITVFYNEHRDVHATIDMTKYTRQLAIIW